MEQHGVEVEAAFIPRCTSTKPRRNKYAWVVLVVSFLTHFLNPSITYASGVFHVALLERYGSDVILTSWLGALYSAMFAFAGPVASLVTNVFDCRTCVFLSGVLGLAGYAVSALVTDIRWLFLTYALTAGLGTAFAQVASVVAVGYYFPQNAALASGFVVAGTALGIFVHPPLVQTFIDWYGLAGAFLLTGALVAHCCIFGLLMRPSKNEKSRKIQMKSGQTRNNVIIRALFGGSTRDYAVFWKMSFWTFNLSTLFFAMGYNTMLLFLPDYLEKEHGALPHDSALMISFLGLGSLISRVCVGALANDKSVGPMVVYSSCLGIAAIVSLFIPFFAQTTGGRFCFGLLVGLYTGGVLALEVPICLIITGIENFALAYGAVMFFLGLGYLTGPPIAGRIYEASDNYSSVFFSSILGNGEVNDEDLITAATGAEALINSRPLTYQCAHPGDDTPLTPNHFLHGQIGGRFAPDAVDETPFHPRKRWRRVQQLVHQFWRRWMREWLPSLNPRTKWNKLKRDLKEGDVVLVISPNIPRGQWQLGRIRATHPGADGHTRVVDVQVGQVVLTRPITKICPLELTPDDEDDVKDVNGTTGWCGMCWDFMDV